MILAGALAHSPELTAIKLAVLFASIATFTIVAGQRKVYRNRDRLAAFFVVFALIFAIVGCGEHYHEGDDKHRSDVVPIVFFKSLPQHSDEAIEDAEEILGLDLSREAYEPGRGAVMLLVHEPVGNHLGENEIVDRCAPMAWSKDEGHALAHEIGHALGLQHTDDRDNLMYPTELDIELTDEQIDFMRWDAWYLQHRC